MRVMLLSAANNVHTVRWANAISERGNDVYVVSCSDHKEANNKFNSNITKIYLKYSSGLGYYLNRNQLRKIIKTIKPDIVNVHYASGYGTLARISKINNYLLNLWGSDIFLYPKINKFNKYILTKNLKYAPHIASTSHCMANEAKLYVNKDMYITPFGIDLNKIKYHEHEIKDNTFKICTVKTLEEVYGIDVLIKAVALLINKLKDNNVNINIKYDIYGKGHLHDSLNELISSLNMNNNIRLMGYIENNKLGDVLTQYNAFILGSRSESFGVSAIEAMAAGLVVIATDAKGFTEVIENNHDGFIVKRDHPEEIADKLYELIQNPKIIKDIGYNAYISVKEKYDWNESVTNMLNIYSKILK